MAKISDSGKFNTKNTKYLSKVNKGKGLFNLSNMDCLKYLEKIGSNNIDLVIIDPPYEVSRSTNFRAGEEKGRDTDRFRVSMDFGEWDHDFKYLDTVISECYRVLKNSGTLICFYDLWKITTLREYFEKADFKQLRLIEWVKTNPVPLNSHVNYLTNNREIAILGVKKGKPTFNSEYDDGIYRHPICHDKGRFHPTQKPESLISELICKHSNKDDKVLDVFSGSGTTAVCALKNQRIFMGCELNKEYYEKSLERIKAEVGDIDE